MVDSWDMQWVTIRGASRVDSVRRDRVMRLAAGVGVLSVSDIADAARLSVSQTRRILREVS
jgi:hypothetical protein